MKTAHSVQTAGPTVDIVVVTYNNLNMLDRCLCSILQNTAEPVRIIVVNNGEEKFQVPDDTKVHIIHTGKNLGWTEGVNLGVRWALDNNPSKFIMWMNDDIQIVPHDYGWLTKMINCFQLDPKIAAVGPTSNNIMGYQTTNHTHLPPAIETTFISGMCVLSKRGIVEEMFPLECCPAGGDDLDFSMRLADKGYKICVCRRAFMLHFCSVTGKRVYGEYWNSPKQGEEINTWLIKKHGFRKWFNCYNNLLPGGGGYDFIKPEEELALKEIEPYLDGFVLDLGCGGKKIHGKAIGVDIRQQGENGVGCNANIQSAANIVADILHLPFKEEEVDCILAKHLFEHILDPLKSLHEWKRVLKDDGKLVIVCPDYRFCEAISVDPSHVHAYTPDTIKSLLEVVGFRVTKVSQVIPGYVFVLSAEKVKVSNRSAIGEVVMA